MWSDQTTWHMIANCIRTSKLRASPSHVKDTPYTKPWQEKLGPHLPKCRCQMLKYLFNTFLSFDPVLATFQSKLEFFILHNLGEPVTGSKELVVAKALSHCSFCYRRKTSLLHKALPFQPSARWKWRDQEEINSGVFCNTSTRQNPAVWARFCLLLSFMSMFFVFLFKGVIQPFKDDSLSSILVEWGSDS